MVEMIKYLIKRVISLFLHVFWLFSIKKNRIFFMNDHSYNFSDNLKYLSLYLIKSGDKSYDIYFSLKNPQGTEELPIKTVKWLSLKHFYIALTSSIVITNNGGTAYLPFRKKQLVINTWHGGGPYKMTGVRAISGRIVDKQAVIKNKSIKWYERSLAYNAQKINWVLLSCKMCIEETRGMYYKDIQTLDIGTPRIDCLFNAQKTYEVKKRVYKEFCIPLDSKLVLYAPTFRGDFENYDSIIEQEILAIDVKRTLDSLRLRFGKNWVFGLRLHPRLKDVLINNFGIINMTLYQDPQELLMASDVLITDYSSIMWDYSFTTKPCFLFAPDLNDYTIRRGFYVPPEEWPFPIATTNDELERLIKEFNANTYDLCVSQHHAYVGSYECGQACKRIKSIIDEHIYSLKGTFINGT